MQPRPPHDVFWKEESHVYSRGQFTMLDLQLCIHKDKADAPLQEMVEDGRERVVGASALDFAFTVCDNAGNEVCPMWPDQPMTAYRGLADPAAAEGSEAERHLAFGCLSKAPQPHKGLHRLANATAGPPSHAEATGRNRSALVQDGMIG